MGGQSVFIIITIIGVIQAAEAANSFSTFSQRYSYTYTHAHTRTQPRDWLSHTALRKTVCRYFQHDSVRVRFYSCVDKFWFDTIIVRTCEVFLSLVCRSSRLQRGLRCGFRVQGRIRFRLGRGLTVVMIVKERVSSKLQKDKGVQ